MSMSDNENMLLCIWRWCILLALLLIAGAALKMARGAEADEPAVVYRGKPRTEAWFEKAYAKFRNKVARVEDAWVDVAEPSRWADELKPGEAARVHGKIVRVLDGNAYLLRLATLGLSSLGKPTVFKPNGQVIQLTLDRPLRRDAFVGSVAGVGTIEHGSRRFVRCLRVPRERLPLTKADFREALRSGFVLGVWRLEKKRRRLRDGTILVRTRHVRRTIK